MSTNAPSATVQLAGQDRTVVFDLARLMAIEAALSKSVFEVADELQPMLPSADTLDGAQLTTEARGVLSPEARTRMTISPGESKRALRAFRIKTVADFAGACFDLAPEAIAAQAAAIFPMTGALVGAFFGALGQLVTGGEETPAHPTPADGSLAAEPGPASS